jgi:hypothetical protein
MWDRVRSRCGTGISLCFWVEVAHDVQTSGHPVRPLPPTVNLRSLVLIGDEVGEEGRVVDLSELLVLALEGERRRISSSVDSRETLRSE